MEKLLEDENWLVNDFKITSKSPISSKPSAPRVEGLEDKQLPPSAPGLIFLLFLMKFGWLRSKVMPGTGRWNLLLRICWPSRIKMYANKIVFTFSEVVDSFLVYSFLDQNKFNIFFLFSETFFLSLVCFLFGQKAQVFKSISSYIYSYLCLIGQRESRWPLVSVSSPFVRSFATLKLTQ